MEKHDSYSFLLISMWNIAFKSGQAETQLQEGVSKKWSANNTYEYLSYACRVAVSMESEKVRAIFKNKD